MKARSIIAVEVSMIVTGVAMICLMAVVAFV